MQEMITVFCIVLIILAILIETDAFFRKLLSLPKNKVTQESKKIILEGEKTEIKLSNKDKTLLPLFMLYDEPLGCPGFGC